MSESKGCTNADAAAAAAEIRSRILLGKVDLPPLPVTAVQVLRVAQSSDADSRVLTEIANRDQALAGQILRFANSPVMAPREPIVSLQQAVVRLGASTVANVAFAVALKGAAFDTGLDAATAAFEWKHSLLVASFAKEVARLRRASVETAFLCGLLHDIGRPILLREWAKVAPDSPPPPLDDVHDSAPDALHAVAGLALVEAWDLPSHVAAAVAGHHDSSDGWKGRDNAATVNVADRLALAAVEDKKFDDLGLVGDDAARSLNLFPDDLTALWQRREALIRSASALG
jgi:putative nucleotidyltransferase with HDIG domain